MKKVVLTSLATLGLALGVFGQGAMIPNNNSAPGYVDLTSNGAVYNGAFTLEVWYKNAAAADNAINSLNGVTGQAANAYALLTADGFSLATSTTATMAGGLFALSEVDIKAPGGSQPPGQAGPGLDRTVNGGSALFAFVFFEGGSTYMSAANGGIVTFVNPTSDWTVAPPNTPVPPYSNAFGGNGAPYTDLIMTVIPEPGTFALAGLGAAALLIFRRRK